MKRTYRSIWISDVHLCTRDSQAELLYNFLDSVRCDYLYLVGDIIDVWALRKKWFWPAQYNEVLHKILKRSRKGARVLFIPGNHDDFFRSFVGMQFGAVKVVANALHTMADGRRFLVIHGDEFDSVVRYHAWLAHLGSFAYRYLVMLNRLVNRVRAAFGKPYWSLSGAIKRRVKQAVSFVVRFENLLAEEAKRQQVDGVICGHIHQPAMYDIDGVLYCNTGDWVESCSVLVEHTDGRLELLYWRDVLAKQRAAREKIDNIAGSVAPQLEPVGGLAEGR